jgi:hypothetical protein
VSVARFIADQTKTFWPGARRVSPVPCSWVSVSWFYKWLPARPRRVVPPKRDRRRDRGRPR